MVGTDGDDERASRLKAVAGVALVELLVDRVELGVGALQSSDGSALALHTAHQLISPAQRCSRAVEVKNQRLVLGARTGHSFRPFSRATYLGVGVTVPNDVGVTVHGRKGKEGH